MKKALFFAFLFCAICARTQNIFLNDLIPMDGFKDEGFFVKFVPGVVVSIDTTNLSFMEPEGQNRTEAIDLIGFSSSTKDSTCIYYIYPGSLQAFCECAPNTDRYYFGDLTILLVGCKMFALDQKFLKQYRVCHD